jgi:pSer/pThr/pTyr-binding forkhead associated (FHA) protein
VIKAAARDLRVPQESFVLAPAHARAAAPETSAPAGRLVVVESPSLPRGEVFETGPVALTFGRAGDNSAVLGSDEFASAHHARVESQRDGVWLLDLGSTNGTWVNGSRMDGRHRLKNGDVIRIGATELRFER